jgi:hypothetical protein
LPVSQLARLSPLGIAVVVLMTPSTGLLLDR